MRHLTIFLCLITLGCTGPNPSTQKQGQPPQDNLKPIDGQEQTTTPITLQSTVDAQREVSAKLPVLTQDNVVALLTEFGRQNPHNKVLIKTSYGDIKIELFEETPLHRANFLYLIQQDYFKDTFFHRIVPNFIIQGGNSDLRSTPKKRKSIGPNYLIPAEINPNRKHTYGTISGAKEYRENPDKLSAPYEFFIFLGPDISGRHLNGNYTIFGQVTQGMDVVETIANLPADQGEWPKSNVYLEVSLDL